MSKELKNLNSAFDKINKMYDSGTIGMLGQMPDQDVERFSSGSIGLDLALGGGYPRSRVIEIYGPESSGKTTLAIHAIAEIQKLGGIAGIIDMEHAFDPEYAKNLGVNIDDLIFSQPDSGEQCWEIIGIILDSTDVQLLVIDSVAAMTPQKELTGDMGDSNLGLHARLMSQGFRKNVGKIKKSGCTVMFINQIRDKIGVMFGSPEVTTGGNALKFYASQRIDIRRGEQVKDGEEVIANRSKVKVVKNKVAPPFKTCQFNLVYGQGIDRITELIDISVELGLLKRSGSWFSYEGTQLGQGKIKTKELLLDNLELVKELEDRVIKLLTPKKE